MDPEDLREVIWPGIAFSPVTLELFEPLGIAPTPKVGQGFGLGFVVRTQEGRNPMPGSPGEYSWAGWYMGHYFLGRSQRAVGCRDDDTSGASSGSLLPFLDPQSRVSGAHRLTECSSITTLSPPLIKPLVRFTAESRQWIRHDSCRRRANS
jgi:hypothetical protein